MIKLICFLRRKPGMSLDDFHGHWLESHGPLIANTPELARHLVRYEQNHRLRSDYARDPDGAPGFDGATIQWLDSMESFFGFVREPKYAELIASDEKRFLDRSSLVVFFSDEEDVKIDGDRGAATVKLLCLLRRKAGSTPEHFHAHWKGPHAAIFAETPEIRRHIVAYHQNHRTRNDYQREGRAAPGGFDGLAEQWYASMDSFDEMAREPRYREQVPDDEEHFIDRAAICFILSAPPDLIVG
jgi:hypothetical protein